MKENGAVSRILRRAISNSTYRCFPRQFSCMPALRLSLAFHRRLSLEDGILRCFRTALYFGVYPFGCRARCAFSAAMCGSRCFLIRVSRLIPPIFVYACRLLHHQLPFRLFGTPLMHPLRCKINAAYACIPETLLTGAHAPIIISTVTAVRHQDPSSSVPVRQRTLPYGA